MASTVDFQLSSHHSCCRPYLAIFIPLATLSVEEGDSTLESRDESPL
jgi:hypothetical protein